MFLENHGSDKAIRLLRVPLEHRIKDRVRSPMQPSPAELLLRPRPHDLDARNRPEAHEFIH